MAAVNPYGLVEAVKRAVVTALVATIDANYPATDEVLRRVAGNVEMEYPAEETKYPGIWVQFSFSEIRRAGLDPTHVVDSVKYEMGFFKGRVTLSVLALSNQERDKIAGAIINLLLFGKLHPSANTFFESLRDATYVSMTVNNDEVRPGGQTTTVGAPWQQDLLVYEDAYSFDVVGQFASRFDTAQLVPLSEIRIDPVNITVVDPGSAPNDGNGTWV